MRYGNQADSYLRFIDSCITQLKAQGPSRTCNESKKEEEKFQHRADVGPVVRVALSSVEAVRHAHHGRVGAREERGGALVSVVARHFQRGAPLEHHLSEGFRVLGF